MWGWSPPTHLLTLHRGWGTDRGAKTPRSHKAPCLGLVVGPAACIAMMAKAKVKGSSLGSGQGRGESRVMHTAHASFCHSGHRGLMRPVHSAAWAVTSAEWVQLQASTDTQKHMARVSGQSNGVSTRLRTS